MQYSHEYCIFLQFLPYIGSIFLHFYYVFNEKTYIFAATKIETE